MKPNRVFIALLAAAGAVAVTLAVLAAEHHGKQRQPRRAYLTGRSIT